MTTRNNFNTEYMWQDRAEAKRRFRHGRLVEATTAV